MKYNNPRSQNNNLFNLFHGQLDYILNYYFANLETTKHNIDKFRTNLLMKHITKYLSYHNIDKEIEKLFIIS